MYNQCTFVGRLGADPQVNQLESGRKVAQFSLACTERGYKKRDGSEVPERTEWIPCVLWGGLAEIAEKYLKKGSVALVVGKFRTRKYDDKQGVTRYVSEIVAEDLTLLPSGGGHGNDAPLPPDPADYGAGQATQNVQNVQNQKQEYTAAQASPAMQAAAAKVAAAFGNNPGDNDLPF